MKVSVLLVCASTLVLLGGCSQRQGPTKPTLTCARSDAAASESPSPGGGMIDATAQRARVLCKEIKAAYAHFRDDPPRKCCIGPDLSSLVTKYIPVGSSFDKAESILRDMRVAVGRNSPVFPGEDVGVALLGSTFPCEHDIVVNLAPRAPGDYSAIAKVHAEIAIICL